MTSRSSLFRSRGGRDGGGGGDPNVQSDWDETDIGSDAFIRNKPTIPAAPGALELADHTVALAEDSAIEIDLSADLPAAGDLHLELRWSSDGSEANESISLLDLSLEAINRRVAQAATPTTSVQSVGGLTYRGSSAANLTDFGHARAAVWRSTDARKLYLLVTHANFNRGVYIWARTF